MSLLIDIKFRSGEEAEVSCDEGFSLGPSDSQKIICRGDGSWQAAQHSASFPVCKEKPCYQPHPSLPGVENGSLDINGQQLTSMSNDVSKGFKPGAVAVYTCHSSFVLVPLSANKRVCARGQWRGQTPTCVLKNERELGRVRETCGSPPSISNGFYLTDRESEGPLALPKVSQALEDYQPGTIARYHCKDGYMLSSFHGQELYRCLSNGLWSPRVPPVCISLHANIHSDPLEQEMCSSPSHLAYADFERVEGWLTSNGAVHGTVLEYSCRVGYRDSITPCLPTRRTCHAGQWVGRLPSCVPFEYCERPPVVSHGFLTSSPETAYHILSEVVYQCHPGYTLQNGKRTASLRCHPSGCWTPNEIPTCVRYSDVGGKSKGGREVGRSGVGGLNDGDETDQVDAGLGSHLGLGDSPFVAMLMSACLASTGVAIVTSACLIVACRRRRKYHSHAHFLPMPSSGPAHWSTMSEHAGRANEIRRAAGGQQAAAGLDPRRPHLVAFADGVQSLNLPSYEEALREAMLPSGSGVRRGLDNRAENSADDLILAHFAPSRPVLDDRRGARRIGSSLRPIECHRNDSVAESNVLASRSINDRVARSKRHGPTRTRSEEASSHRGHRVTDIGNDAFDGLVVDGNVFVDTNSDNFGNAQLARDRSVSSDEANSQA